MRAALILVGLGTLAVMEIQTPPRATKSVATELAQATLSFAAPGDTLTAADRLEIPHAQQQASLQQIFSSEPIAPPVQSAAAAAEPAPIVEPPARAVPAAKPVVVLPKPRPKQLSKHEIAKETAKTTRSKPTVEAKSCQPGAFDGLFKALSLPLGCQT
ncbi:MULTISPECIES: hypothetical protein [unclassified Bradyrhizobium]